VTVEALLNEAHSVLTNILGQRMAQDDDDDTLSLYLYSSYPILLPAWDDAWGRVEAIVEKIEDYRVDGDGEAE
jgi:hypothetical protein